MFAAQADPVLEAAGSLTTYHPSAHPPHHPRKKCMAFSQQIWWPAKQCLVFCSHVPKPGLGQMLTEVAVANNETKRLWHTNKLQMHIFLFYKASRVHTAWVPGTSENSVKWCVMPRDYSIQCQGYKCMQLYFHSPKFSGDIFLNYA
jgi:hypothetical protein